MGAGAGGQPIAEHIDRDRFRAEIARAPQPRRRRATKRLGRQLNALAENELGLINAISAVPIARTPE